MLCERLVTVLLSCCITKLHPKTFLASATSKNNVEVELLIRTSHNPSPKQKCFIMSEPGEFPHLGYVA